MDSNAPLNYLGKATSAAGMEENKPERLESASK